jgi:hypothetical protein
MSIEIPNIEDKILEIFYEKKDHFMSVEEFNQILSDAMNSKGITIDDIITTMSINIENGSTIQIELEKFEKIIKYGK